VRLRAAADMDTLAERFKQRRKASLARRRSPLGCKALNECRLSMSLDVS
jgi:hypothetical protein